MKALILLAHGSRNPASCKEVAGLAEALGRDLPEQIVIHAFLDGLGPTLPQALEQVVRAGATHVDVLPLFLHSGNHVTRDIPEMIRQARCDLPEADIRLLRHIGAHPGCRELVREMAVDPERYAADG